MLKFRSRYGSSVFVVYRTTSSTIARACGSVIVEQAAIIEGYIPSVVADRPPFLLVNSNDIGC